MSVKTDDVYYKAKNLNFSFFSSIKNLPGRLAETYKAYVETDASGGTTIFGMAPHFEELYSIQLNTDIKKVLIDEYTGKKIKWYSNSGSSLGSLSGICSQLKLNCFFYLNYNNYSPDNDCLIENYVRAIVSNCKFAAIVAIDSFGLINGCITIKDDETESGILQKRIKDSCGLRLSKSYIVGSTSSGRYRLVLHLDKKAD